MCNKIVSGYFKKPLKGQLGRIAVHHGDHVVVVDYDYFGHVRSVNAFKVYPIPNSGKIHCPLCKKPIKIVDGNKVFDEYAFIHDDHVAIVYVFKKCYQIETIPLVMLKVEKPISIIKHLLNKIGLKELSGIIVYALVNRKIEINEKWAEIEELFSKISILNNIPISRSQKMVSFSEFSNKFIERILSLVKDLPEEEGLRKLNDMLIFIWNFAKLLSMYQKTNAIIAQELLEKISDLSLRELLVKVSVNMG